MRYKNKMMAFIVLVILGFSFFVGCVEQQPDDGPDGFIYIPSVSASGVSNPKYALAAYYTSEEMNISASPNQYTLPIDSAEIVNFEDISNYYSLSTQQKNLLKKNGFVIINFGVENDTVAVYDGLKENNIPIFVTSDSLLHLYHVQFAEILRGIEEREFFNLILDLTQALFDASVQDYRVFSDNDLKEAAFRNSIYFGVGLELLQTPTDGYDFSESIKEVEYTFPVEIESIVAQELALIKGHQGFTESPLFKYEEDYSQYNPRGHYTRSEKLKRYFMTLMWFGRLSFLLKGGSPACSSCDYLISEEDAKIATLQACLISTYLPSISIDDSTLEELWNRMYIVTAFFVGAADDLTPFEYLDAIRKVFGNSFNASDLLDDDQLLNLKYRLLQFRNPQIYGGTGNVVVIPPVTEEKLDEVLEKTKGMRFMGQRFIPDSYMFQHLTTTTGNFVGTGNPFTMCITGAGRKARCFPRGLDVMAVLGSERAYEILKHEGDTDYRDDTASYDQNLEQLRDEFSETAVNISGWNRNLYWSWLYTLKALLNDFDENYPVFMQEKAWLDKELQTVLASWTQLRHDTILYAKQSYTMRELGSGPGIQQTKGYVEPVPEFYIRLQALVDMTIQGLSDLNVLTETEMQRLQTLKSVLTQLIDISSDILEGKPLSDADYAYIHNIGEHLKGSVVDIEEKGQQTTIIADVHTDANTLNCLEEAVGFVDIILVAYCVDQNVFLGAGPVLSYYEFKQPISNRLTDEEWVSMLNDHGQPDRPMWIQTFHST